MIAKTKNRPTIMEGPLITTIVDAISLMVYFSIASWIIKFLKKMLRFPGIFFYFCNIIVIPFKGSHTLIGVLKIFPMNLFLD